MKDLQSHGLQNTTTILQRTASNFIREDSPTPDPERPPKNHLQNRFISWQYIVPSSHTFSFQAKALFNNKSHLLAHEQGERESERRAHEWENPASSVAVRASAEESSSGVRILSLFVEQRTPLESAHWRRPQRLALHNGLADSAE
jgi:hypothetical protein